jgi:aminoglycoside phosphotransferase (APT) family kinase protein
VFAVVYPDEKIHGAVLMEYLNGSILDKKSISANLAHQCGAILAKIHTQKTEGYGDLTDVNSIATDPRIVFSHKFEEGMSECEGHLPKTLLDKIKRHFAENLDLLLDVDGPCIVHHDFRPANILVAGDAVLGVIDWSSAKAGFSEEDFCPFEFGEWPKEQKDTFFKGYETVREVPNYPRIIPLLRLSRAVAAVGFTVKRDIFRGKGAGIYQFSRSYLESLLPM